MAIPITEAMAADKTTIKTTRAAGREDGFGDWDCKGTSGRGMVGGAKELGRPGGETGGVEGDIGGKTGEVEAEVLQHPLQSHPASLN